MNTLKSSGFTLIEMMIALALASIIMLGLYSMFDSITDNKAGLDRRNDNMYIMQAVERIIARDIRMMTTAATPPLTSALSETDEDDILFSLYTNNSLTFNKSIPVAVVYSIDNATLYREEFEERMEYSMRMPILDNVSDGELESYISGEYVEGFNNSMYLFRFTFTMGDNSSGDALKEQFITGRGVSIE